MIDLDTFADAGTIRLDEPRRKLTSVRDDQHEASKNLFVSDDGLVKVGVWECTPGRFSADRSASSEVCHIISGRATLTRLDGETREITAGDVLVLPRGWKGDWDIVETLRKVFVVYEQA